MTKSRRILLVVLSIAIAGALWFLLYRSDRSYDVPEQAAFVAAAPATPAVSRPAVNPPPGPPGSTRERASLPRPIPPSFPAAQRESGPDASPAPALPAQVVTEAVRSAIQKYGAAFGGNPVGTNAEITRALNGDNPTHANFLAGIPGQQINSKGELVDPWGTPYFFHQLSGTEMEVHSAGPDRTLWNADDLISK